MKLYVRVARCPVLHKSMYSPPSTSLPERLRKNGIPFFIKFAVLFRIELVILLESMSAMPDRFEMDDEAEIPPAAPGVNV